MTILYTLTSIIIFLGGPNWATGGDIHLELAKAALGQVGVTIEYAPKYVNLKYPGGDVPLHKGVCADVIVRAFRSIGIDLQQSVHKDMTEHFDDYPQLWGLKKPDANIDHRRVPNLMTFLKRQKKAVTDSNYEPGDVVAWRLPSDRLHIGMVSSELVPGEQHYFMIHNIGAGAKKEDVLHNFTIIAHYRW